MSLADPRVLDTTRCAVGWYRPEKSVPKCDRKSGSFGVQVLIWPPHEAEGSSDAYVAFYGCRVTDEPNFYLYGRCIHVTHWMPLPHGPKS